LDHYFTDPHQTVKNRKEILFRFLGVEYRFATADRVFSKDHVDPGTKLLLETLEPTTLRGRVLDYGCGYGVIAIVCAKMSQLVIEASDVVDRALVLTRQNATINGVEVNAFPVSDLPQAPCYDLILTNPPVRAGKAVIYQMFETARQLLLPQGYLRVVLRKQQGSQSALKELLTRFGNSEVLASKKGYQILQAQKRLDG
jgi:16S rRNA (guanine1207-N2)-methyltransferase